MSNCEICGQKLAGSKEGYKTHIQRFHNVTAHPEPYKSHIKPVRTTNRSFDRIVFDKEKTWYLNIFPVVKPWDTFVGA